jgi:hypothetical protein
LLITITPAEKSHLECKLGIAIKGEHCLRAGCPEQRRSHLNATGKLAQVDPLPISEFPKGDQLTFVKNNGYTGSGIADITLVSTILMTN